MTQRSLLSKAGFLPLSFLLLVVFCTATFVHFKPWEKSPIEWDITLYYSYLPATFIYHDFDVHASGEKEWGQRHFYMKEDAEGNRYVKMTSGLSMLYSPFFLAAHAYALVSPNYEANGFGKPYDIGILLSSLLFALAGLWCLARFLLQYFPEKVVGLSILVVFLGTNMPYYSMVSPMSHVYNFALVSFILLQTDLYLRRQALWRAVFIGAAVGLLVLIRPTNILALIFPVLLVIYKWRNLTPGLLYKHLALVVVVAFMACLPQLLYWKHMTGHWLIYSYNEEGFFFTNPQIWNGLFSYRKGWFTYSPVLFVALLGFPFLFRKYPRYGWAIIATLIPALWVTFSWWCWWYGGGFGARPLIEFLPFMALPLAAVFGEVLLRKFWLQIPALAVAGFLCYWALVMNFQFHRGMIHYDSMSKELYWDQFLKKHYVENFEEKLDPPDYDAALKGKY